jgi:hypothetical protein
MEQMNVDEAKAALYEIARKQRQVLGIIETNGFIFDDIGSEPGNWKHLAFTLYCEICEIDLIARGALGLPLGVDPPPAETWNG